MSKGIGGWISDNIFGSTNDERAQGRQVSKRDYTMGVASPAETMAQGYNDRGAAAQNRQATQASNVDVNYAQANADRAMGQQARGQQNSLAQIMANRATGGGPTVAQMQADRQMGQSLANQSAMAGSARGAGGLAAAQRNAAFANANASADISGQAQINAANERRDDTNAAAGMYSNLRQGDLANQGQSANQAQFRTQNAVQQNQFNAGLRDAQSARNDARQLSYDQLGNQVRTTQLGANMNFQAQQSANDLGAQGINAGVGGQNASMNQANGMNAVGMAQSAASIPFMGGSPQAKAKGGPTTGGKPYLVGEQGPELVIPQKDGYVLTADQTRNALAGSPADTILGLFHQGHQQTRGSSLAAVLGGARADGGPVEGGGAVAAGQMAPPPAAPPPGYAPPMSTWGTGQPDPQAGAWEAAQAQQARMQPYDDLGDQIAAQRSGIDATANRVNASVADIDQRDKDAVWNADYKDRHGQSSTREEDDAATEARFRQSDDAQRKRDAAKKKRGLADVLADNGKRQQQEAAAIDTSYHGSGGGFVPPQLIQIAGARAGGGPMFGGGLVPMGPQMGTGVGGGIEFGGGGISHNDLLRAGSGLASPQAIPGMVGGGGITGGSSMGGQAIPGVAGAREDGGPIKAEQTTADTKAGAIDLAKLAALSTTANSPALTAILGAQAAGVGGAAAAMSAEDTAARKAREDQAALDADRAAMNAAERGGGPVPTHSAADTVLEMSTKPTPAKEIPWRKQRSLWDILRGH